MRFSSIVGLVVVTASFALGGCAADAEPADVSTGDNVAHEGNLEEDRTDDLRLLPRRADERAPQLPPEARTRIIEGQKFGAVDPHVVLSPPELVHHRLAPRVLTPEEMRDAAEAHNTGAPKP